MKERLKTIEQSDMQKEVKKLTLKTNAELCCLVVRNLNYLRATSFSLVEAN